MPYPAKISVADIQRAALRILEDQGLEALSMRPLAEALGVRASSLYRHVAHREALLSLLSEEAAVQLRGALEGAAVSEAPGRPALEALSRAFLAFAQRRPQLYALMHLPRPPESGAGESQRLWQFVLGRVSRASGLPDDTAGTVALWAFLHGYVELERSGLFGLSGPAGGFERGLEALSGRHGLGVVPPRPESAG
ncbi:TetR/AcrR family transcriptional regulator [Deinococcus sp.]|uniref:TetR/AcrR family transcriptional regulator n=1 Tax=Deinococcus sp. TaxID=47478 RepID=UPI003C7B1B62